MKTAQDALRLIDDIIARLYLDLSSICVDAFLEPLDGDYHREALIKSSELRSLKALRSVLAREIAGTKITPIDTTPPAS